MDEKTQSNLDLRIKIFDQTNVSENKKAEQENTEQFK